MSSRRYSRRVTTSLLPQDIAVAAASDMALRRWAKSLELIAGTPEGRVFVATPRSADEPRSIWVDPQYRYYRKVWQRAARTGLVDELDAWGSDTDVDHLYPRSWANDAGLRFVRLHPVWAEVNRSAGGGREKQALATRSYSRLVQRDGIVYADELQILKLLGHPVGTAAKPEEW